jgi:hypothetical protein
MAFPGALTNTSEPLVATEVAKCSSINPSPATSFNILARCLRARDRAGKESGAVVARDNDTDHLH